MPFDSGISEEVIGRLRDGDEQELAELFSRFRPRLKQMVEFRMDHRLRGRVDASDVLQEAYLDVRQRLRHFLGNPEQSFYIWLRYVTMQRLIDTHRRHLAAKMRDAGQEVHIDRLAWNATSSVSMAAWFVGQLTSPSQMAMRAELLGQLEDALESMEPIDREILVLRHFEELRNSEIAEVLHISPAAASNRYVRALSRLGTILADIPGFLDGAPPE